MEEGWQIAGPGSEAGGFMLSSFLDSFSMSKKVSKKWFPRVPTWTPKVDQNRQKGRSGGVSKRGPQKGPPPGPGKVRFCYYLLYFSKVRDLRKGSFLGTILESILERKS